MEKEYSFTQCPICKTAITLDGGSLVCKNRHNFDIAKKGYVNLLQKQPKSKYSKELFMSRRRANQSGFFTPLITTLAKIIDTHCDNQKLTVLDVGCGEGSHLTAVKKLLQKNYQKQVITAGFDIAKEGVQLAAGKDRETLWYVADLGNIPFAANSFDIILNILTPSNNLEFTRILKPDGLVIKVVPAQNYLQQVRQFFYKGEQSEYSNEEVLVNFQKGFTQIGSERLTYVVNLPEEQLVDIIKMSPLSWNQNNTEIAQAAAFCKGALTADFTVLIGKRKTKTDG